MPINYELAKQENPKLKSALTRAEKKGYSAVLAACKHAVSRWEAWGCWPDAWSTWQRALDASALKARKGGEYIIPARLENLSRRTG